MLGGPTDSVAPGKNNDASATNNDASATNNDASRHLFMYKRICCFELQLHPCTNDILLDKDCYGITMYDRQKILSECTRTRTE